MIVNNLYSTQVDDSGLPFRPEPTGTRAASRQFRQVPVNSPTEPSGKTYGRWKQYSGPKDTVPVPASSR